MTRTRSAPGTPAPVRAPRFLLASPPAGGDPEELRATAVGEAVRRAVGATGPAGVLGDRTGEGASLRNRPPSAGAGALPVAGGVPTDALRAAARAAVAEAALALPSARPATAATSDGNGGPEADGTTRSTAPATSGGGPGAAVPLSPTDSRSPAENRPAADATAQPADLDALVEAVQERLLAEIERRGGRYGEVF